eukprot:TRINITY_DN11662_c0_g1_i1.p1 TRINITY_DN11662_c0_g1~~TRINITY_DN11662_c0_g1_i1.p1  ORF type:complete len:325 (-),score=87.59 TRINITY_DN11662_c0_g1_i1:41-1015(-)
MRVILVAALLSIALAFETETLFENFKVKYNKVYATPEEHDLRFGIFSSNLKLASKYNALEGNSIYGVTKFMDLTPEEFRGKYLMPKGSIKHNYEQEFVNFNVPAEIPQSFDWVSKGAVTPVKDQGQCGSCWAFSATEAIESQWFLTKNQLPVLAPQQIVDCDVNNGDEGCNGGDTPTAYEYVIKQGGLDTEASYPYTAEDGTCKFQQSTIGATIKSWTYITQNKNETEMQAKLVALGPQSICVDASSWQFYVGGAVTSFCGNSLDHCVMITGYKPYTDVLGFTFPVWLVRNSWGADWGESGFIFVEIGSDLCGVADEVTIPLVN